MQDFTINSLEGRKKSLKERDSLADERMQVAPENLSDLIAVADCTPSPMPKLSCGKETTKARRIAEDDRVAEVA